MGRENEPAPEPIGNDQEQQIDAAMPVLGNRPAARTQHSRNGEQDEGRFRPGEPRIEYISQHHLRHPEPQRRKGEEGHESELDDAERAVQAVKRLGMLLSHGAPASSRVSAAARLPKARVPSGPPRSRVRQAGLAIMRSSARSIVTAARPSASEPRLSPSQASSIAAEPISEEGLAMSWPAISGAEPCWAWAKAWRSPTLSDAASPRLPEISAARSERMSPYMFVVAITS